MERETLRSPLYTNGPHALSGIPWRFDLKNHPKVWMLKLSTTLGSEKTGIKSSGCLVRFPVLFAPSQKYHRNSLSDSVLALALSVLAENRGALPCKKAK